MDKESEINKLTSETIALTAVLAEVLLQIANTSTKMHAAVARGFDNAAGKVEHLAIALSKDDPSHRAVQALGVIENLRTATLGDHHQPKHGV